MSEDLENEVEVIRSIYSNETLRKADDDDVYILALPQLEASLRIFFPPEYPQYSPRILGTQGIGEHTRKGHGAYVVAAAKEALERVYTPGLVCVYDLLQELDSQFANQDEDDESLSSTETEDNVPQVEDPTSSDQLLEEKPIWVLSAPVTEKKSTFVARACHVDSPTQAHAYIAHLLATDKRAAKATHNIAAYRIRSPASAGSSGAIMYQDCDDDGETAAGGRLLHLLQVMDVWDVLVVVSRWYGGVKLGPDRFSIINNVARQAVVEGGWTKTKMIKD